MKLIDMKVNEFIDILSSNAPAPGGGSVAALEGALGISLTNMVAELTVGKKKYAEFEELMKDTIAESTKFKKEFSDIIDKDTEAFNMVSTVFKMPKETEEEKSVKKEAMQKALKESTKVPLDVMELSLKSLKTTEAILGKSNINAASDIGVSALSLKSAVQGAWLNVLINVAGINDSDFVNKSKINGEKILKESIEIADRIYMSVLQSL